LNKKLEVRLLGKFEARRDGKTITITSRSAQSLFAYLILNAGISYRREKLAGMLWPDSLEETARDNLRHALWRVRKAFEPALSLRFLRSDDLTIDFDASADYRLDADEVENVSENASTDELIAVLSQYQERCFWLYDEWVVLERQHLYSIFEHHMAIDVVAARGKRWLDVLDWAER
jgi:DNA-binding SARP family transcriptional activator